MATSLDDNQGYLLTNAAGNVMLATGTSVPADGTANYAVGAEFIKTNGAGGNIRFYNDGSATSSAFRAAGSTASRAVYEDFAAEGAAGDLVSVLSGSYAAGGARVVTTNVANHIYTPAGNIFTAWNIVQQDIAPVMVATGLDIGCDQTDNDGMEICTNAFGATGRPFVIGSSPAFYFKCTVTFGDVSGCDTLVVGFRAMEAANVTLASYGTYAGIGLNTAANPGALKLIGENDGTVHTNYPIDTTDTMADAATKIFGIFVSAAGVVSYTINGVAPTATGPAAFDDGDLVIPFFHYLHATTSPGSVIIGKWDCGFQ